jgi:hypothetical protein
VQRVEEELGHVVVIGHGNVGTWLHRLLSEGGAKTSWLQGRSLKSEDILGCGDDVQFWLLAVPDDALRPVAAQLPKAGMRVHFSGATSVDALSLPGESIPSLVTWPMESIRDPLNRHPFGITWLYTEGPVGDEMDTSPRVRAWLKWIEASGGRVLPADDHQRARAHVASVFAANYTANLLRVARALSKESGLDWELWRPMVETSMARLWSEEDHSLATGPAARNDRALLLRQFEALRDHPNWQDVYGRLADLALAQSGFSPLFHKRLP